MLVSPFAATADPVPGSVSAFLAVAETAPVTPALIGELASVDVASLSGADRLAAIRVWERVVNYSQAQRALLVASVGDAQWPDVDERINRRDLTLLELSAALQVSIDYAGWQQAVATQLTRVLRATWAAAASGDLGWRYATDLAEYTEQLAPELAGAVEAIVLPKAAQRTLSQHRRALRTAVERVDPDGSRDRREAMRKDMRLVARHVGDGIGTLFARMPSEDVELVWTACDAHARRAKAAGDQRSLDVLRIAALTTWAKSFLSHGDPTHCDRECHPTTPAPPTETPTPTETPEPTATPTEIEPTGAEPSTEVEPAGFGRPRRHGRAVDVRVLWDLKSLLDVASESGELAVAGANLASDTMRELLAGGVRLRRLLIDPDTGELLDLTPRSWTVPATNGDVHPAPVTLDIVIDTDPSPLATDLQAVIEAAPVGLADAVRAMLAYPVTADHLDDHPDAATPSAGLAQFVAVRDRHPVTPAAGLSDAAAADLDHGIPRSAGGTTTKDNLASVSRRWHRAKTFAWTVHHNGREWIWTSPLGRTYRTRPHDYRRGP